MKGKGISSGIFRYVIYGLVSLLLVSTVIVGSVFGKYTSSNKHNISLVVDAYGEINVSLCEGETTSPWKDSAHKLLITPGVTMTFNPYVCLAAGSESSYVYLEFVVENNTFSIDETEYEYIEYAIASGWTKGDGTNIPENVYYRETSKSTAQHQYLGIFDNDSISFPEELTDELLTALDESRNDPKITITVYAVQKTALDEADNENAAAAWNWLQTQS